MALQALANFAHTAAEPPAQQSSQSHAFWISDFGDDLVDAGVAGPEKVYRALYPQVLEEGVRANTKVSPIPTSNCFAPPTSDVIPCSATWQPAMNGGTLQ